MKLLEKIKNPENPDDDMGKDLPLDPSIFLVSQEDKTAEELETLERAGFKSEQLADGRFLVKSAYDDDFGSGTFESRNIKNPLLKSVLAKLEAKERIDHAFIRKHQKAFKYAFERVNPGVKFEIEKYRDLVIEVEAMTLDNIILSAPENIHVQKAPCKDIDGKAAPTAVTKFERFTPICVSASMLAQIPKRLLETELVGLWYHELAHQHKIGEKGAELLQEYIIEEIMSGRMELRMYARSMRMQIDGTMEYAMNNTSLEGASSDVMDIKYIYSELRKTLAEARTIVEKVMMFTEKDDILRTIRVLDKTIDKLNSATTREAQVKLINEFWAQSLEFSASIPNRY